MGSDTPIAETQETQTDKNEKRNRARAVDFSEAKSIGCLMGLSSRSGIRYTMGIFLCVSAATNFP
jgi:hypothetical protein